MHDLRGLHAGYGATMLQDVPAINRVDSATTARDDRLAGPMKAAAAHTLPKLSGVKQRQDNGASSGPSDLQSLKKANNEDPAVLADFTADGGKELPRHDDFLQV